MSELRERADPHLAVLKTISTSMRRTGRPNVMDVGRQLETARFNIYSALEGSDVGRARNWLNALETAMKCAPKDLVPNGQEAFNGLVEIIDPASSSVLKPLGPVDRASMNDDDDETDVACPRLCKGSTLRYSGLLGGLYCSMCREGWADS